MSINQLLPLLIYFELISCYPSFDSYGAIWHIQYRDSMGRVSTVDTRTTPNIDFSARTSAEERYEDTTNTLLLAPARLGLRIDG